MRKWLAIAVALGMTGCKSDDANSLSRAIRNMNNEAIDALMTVTRESQAKWVNEKILKTYSERLGEVETRMDKWTQTTENKDVCINTLTSESVSLLLAEDMINRRRLKHEVARVKRIIDTRVQQHVDEAIAAGELEKLKADGAKDPMGIIVGRATEDTKKEWPTLFDMAAGTTTTALKAALGEGAINKGGGRFAELLASFHKKEWGEKNRPTNFKELTQEFQDRVKAFEGAAVF
jgi:hypothetical protein